MNIPISSGNDINNFRDSLLKTKKKFKANVILSDIKSQISMDDLNLLDMTLDTAKPSVTVRVFGSIGINSAMLLSRRFRRHAYKGYSIDMKIESNVPASEKQLIQDRMLRLCKDDKKTAFQPRLLAGDNISVDDCLELGLLDKIIDPFASKSKTPKIGVVATADATKSDTQV